MDAFKRSSTEKNFKNRVKLNYQTILMILFPQKSSWAVGI